MQVFSTECKNSLWTKPVELKHDNNNQLVTFVSKLQHVRCKPRTKLKFQIETEKEYCRFLRSLPSAMYLEDVFIKYFC